MSDLRRLQVISVPLFLESGAQDQLELPHFLASAFDRAAQLPGTEQCAGLQVDFGLPFSGENPYCGDAIQAS